MTGISRYVIKIDFYRNPKLIGIVRADLCDGLIMINKVCGFHLKNKIYNIRDYGL